MALYKDMGNLSMKYFNTHSYYGTVIQHKNLKLEYQEASCVGETLGEDNII